jgi:hypothetical protein
MKRFLHILTISLFVSAANAQEIIPKFTFNVDLGLPVTLRNKPFNSYMQGLVCTNIYGQYSFPFHLNLGLGIRYSLFNINEFSVPEANNGSIHTGAAFVKIGWDKYITERFAMDLGVRAGYSLNYAVTDLNKALGENPREIGAVLIEPTLGFILSADEQNSYRLHIGYCIETFPVSPQTTLGFPSDSGFDPSEYGKTTQFLVFGFGYTHYFKNKSQ